jgi:hypothetical protein
MIPKLTILARARNPGRADPDLEDRACGAIVHIVPALERRDQPGIAGKVRHHPQLDLRVVGADQHRARRRDERLSNPAAALGSHRDVL